MVNLINLAEFSFHDALLVAVDQYDSETIFSIEYYDENDVESFATATITGIEAIYCDDIPIQKIEIEGAYGSIFDLTKDENEIILVVFWRTDTSRAGIPYTYKLRGSAIRLQAETK